MIRMYKLPYPNAGRSNRDDERTVLSELVPTVACLNSSSAGVSLFWSSVVRDNRSLWPARKRRAFGTSGIR